MNISENTTLCYIQRGDNYLLMHRIKKKNDENADKWVGVGGHFEPGESPDECVLRETEEETGLRLTSWKMRGIITFELDGRDCEYIHLFTADAFEGEPGECDEGELEWVERRRMSEKPMWEGDRIFLNLIIDDTPFFLLKLSYDKDGALLRAKLNGETLSLESIK